MSELNQPLNEQWNALSQAQRKQLIDAFRHMGLVNPNFPDLEVKPKQVDSWHILYRTATSKALWPRYFDSSMGKWFLTDDGIALANFASDQKLTPPLHWYLIHKDSFMATSDIQIAYEMEQRGWKFVGVHDARFRLKMLETYYPNAKAGGG